MFIKIKKSKIESENSLLIEGEIYDFYNKNFSSKIQGRFINFSRIDGDPIFDMGNDYRFDGVLSDHELTIYSKTEEMVIVRDIDDHDPDYGRISRKERELLSLLYSAYNINPKDLLDDSTFKSIKRDLQIKYITE